MRFRGRQARCVASRPCLSEPEISVGVAVARQSTGTVSAAVAGHDLKNAAASKTLKRLGGGIGFVLWLGFVIVAEHGEGYGSPWESWGTTRSKKSLGVMILVVLWSLLKSWVLPVIK